MTRTTHVFLAESYLPKFVRNLHLFRLVKTQCAFSGPLQPYSLVPGHSRCRLVAYTTECNTHTHTHTHMGFIILAVMNTVEKIAFQVVTEV